MDINELKNRGKYSFLRQERGGIKDNAQIRPSGPEPWTSRSCVPNKIHKKKTDTNFNVYFLTGKYNLTLSITFFIIITNNNTILSLHN